MGFGNRLMSTLFQQTANELSSRLGAHWERSDEGGVAVFRNIIVGETSFQELGLFQDFYYPENNTAKVHCVSVPGDADLVLMGTPDEAMYSMTGPGYEVPTLWESVVNIKQVVNMFITLLEKSGAIAGTSHKRKRDD